MIDRFKAGDRERDLIMSLPSPLIVVPTLDVPGLGPSVVKEPRRIETPSPVIAPRRVPIVIRR